MSSPYGEPVSLITDLTEPESPNGKDVFTPASRADWRTWLSSNWDRREGLWVVYRNLKSGLEGPLYVDLVEEALCFGWIDSVSRRVDDARRIQWFSPRRPGGIWSALNKERIERLQRDGSMTEMGQAVIDRARADGSWSQTDEVDALIVPADLEAALDASPGAAAVFAAMPNSTKRQHLWSVYSAKRPETRAKRIADLIETLSAG
jgi:uncharacterized protein YdeI (YjbR/CyaY-like superfamily)